ncbi:MAG: DUF2156 domain-containing protein, partial [Myxococcales bacterium]|nr:DUF2156 domain-containing protein [Myxococcales bacterium]
MTALVDRWHSPPPDADRAQVLALLATGGVGPTCFQALERGLSHWFDPAGDGAVAYVPAGRWWVAAGCPIAPPARQGAVGAAFVSAARARGRRAVFFGVEASFLQALAAAGVAHDALQVAEQPDWDPRAYHTQGPSRRSLRAQVRRAANKGVVVRRIGADELARRPGSLRAEIEWVLDRWLASRRMSVMRFMVDLEPFTFPEARRYYLAEQGDRAVGFLAAVP